MCPLDLERNDDVVFATPELLEKRNISDAREAVGSLPVTNASAQEQPLVTLKSVPDLIAVALCPLAVQQVGQPFPLQTALHHSLLISQGFRVCHGMFMFVDYKE